MNEAKSSIISRNELLDILLETKHLKQKVLKEFMSDKKIKKLLNNEE